QTRAVETVDVAVVRGIPGYADAVARPAVPAARVRIRDAEEAHRAVDRGLPRRGTPTSTGRCWGRSAGGAPAAAGRGGSGSGSRRGAGARLRGRPRRRNTCLLLLPGDVLGSLLVKGRQLQPRGVQRGLRRGQLGAHLLLRRLCGVQRVLGLLTSLRRRVRRASLALLGPTSRRVCVRLLDLRLAEHADDVEPAVGRIAQIVVAD